MAGTDRVDETTALPVETQVVEMVHTQRDLHCRVHGEKSPESHDEDAGDATVFWPG